MLSGYFLNILNKAEGKSENISITARNFISNHDWPGNIREIDNTFKRIFMWYAVNIITEKDVKENILSIKKTEKKTKAAEMLGYSNHQTLLIE